eukprot:1185379-Prorocentrum_minimum.AAC.4
MGCCRPACALEWCSSRVHHTRAIIRKRRRGWALLEENSAKGFGEWGGRGDGLLLGDCFPVCAEMLLAKTDPLSTTLFEASCGERCVTIPISLQCA